MAPRRPQPYRLKWPLTPSQVEGLDEMLQILFKSAFAAEGRTPTSSTPGGPGAPGPPGSDGANGEDGNPGPPGIQGAAGAAGATGPPGAQGPAVLGFPGVDGEDGADSIVPGPRGNDGGTGPAGAQGATGRGVPGADGEDGEMGWPGPPGPAGAGGGAGGGGLVLLEQHTASASAQLDFTTCITSLYDEYMIEFINVIPASSGVIFQLRVSTDGGATYVSTTDYFQAASSVGLTAGVAAIHGLSQTSFQLFPGTATTASRGGVSGSIKLFDPLTTATRTHISYKLKGSDTTPEDFNIDGMGLWNLTTAVNALRFFFSSGNIASGVIRVYGLAK